MAQPPTRQNGSVADPVGGAAQAASIRDAIPGAT
jgi:hypothetical protein